MKYTVAKIAVDENGEWEVAIFFPPEVSGKGVAKWGRLTRKNVDAVARTVSSRLRAYKDYYIEELRKQGET